MIESGYMGEQQQVSERAAHFITFATLGVGVTTQDLARSVLDGIAEADPDLVAEEALCLTAITTARAAEVGLEAEPALAEVVVVSLLDLPFTYRDYLVGSALMIQQDVSLLDTNRVVYERLQRKRAFYTAHLPPRRFPGERLLTEKMELWMGRVSPPKLPESPAERLKKLNSVDILLTHLKLVLAYARGGGLPG